jgi:hypothetical protein
MRTQVNRTAQFGELVAAAYDGAACYSRDPREVSRLAAGAVSLMLRHTRQRAFCQLQPKTGMQTTNLCQST